MRISERCKTVLLSSVLAMFLAPARAAQAPAPGAGTPAAMPAVIPIPPEAQATPQFNAEAATEAYLRLIPAEATARSDAYFEGGYWLILWDFLCIAVICLLLLNLRWSAKMRDWAERITRGRFRPLQTFLYWVQYLLAVFVLSFPLGVYEGYFREH